MYTRTFNSDYKIECFNPQRAIAFAANDRKEIVVGQYKKCLEKPTRHRFNYIHNVGLNLSQGEVMKLIGNFCQGVFRQFRVLLSKVFFQEPAKNFGLVMEILGRS